DGRQLRPVADRAARGGRGVGPRGGRGGQQGEEAARRGCAFAMRASCLGACTGRPYENQTQASRSPTRQRGADAPRWPGGPPPTRAVVLTLRLRRALWSERADDRARLPQLAVGHLLEFFLQLLAVVGAAVRLQHAPRLVALGHPFVQLLEDRTGRV